MVLVLRYLNYFAELYGSRILYNHYQWGIFEESKQHFIVICVIVAEYHGVRVLIHS